MVIPFDTASDHHKDSEPQLDTTIDSAARVSVRPRWIILASIVALIFALLPHLDLLGGGVIPILQALLPTAAILVLISVAVTVIATVIRAANKARYRPRQNWWVVPLILALGAAIGMVPMLLRPPRAAPPAEIPTRSIRVLSLNVQFSGADVSALSDVMAEWAPHIVMFIEVDEGFISRLAETGALEALALRYRTGDTAGLSGAAGTVVLSTWPLSEFGQVPSVGWHLDETGEVVFDGHYVGFQQPTAIVSVPDSWSIQLAALHPPPPVFDSYYWHQGLQAIGAWQQGVQRQYRPLIIAGDFNASTAHPVFRRATAGLTNTASAVGLFPRPTWPANSVIPPFTQIDHILVSRQIAALNWHRFTIPGTDHFGVIAELAVPVR